MKPEIDQILTFSAMKIMGEFAPAMATQYGQGMAQVVAGLLLQLQRHVFGDVAQPGALAQPLHETTTMSA